MSGAINFMECRSASNGRTCRCKPKCKVCGFPKHTAIHAPHLGRPPGSKPYGHEFIPDTLGTGSESATGRAQYKTPAPARKLSAGAPPMIGDRDE